MLSVEFTFPAGRYHATPWGRHVNEGEVAWPPEPWRVVRALIGAWHHKVKVFGRHRPETLAALVESLAHELPVYALPAATHSHTRHYMPQAQVGATSLVFDAFTAVSREEPLVMTWAHVNLPADQAALLDDLLQVLGYLGRAESWVEARRVTDVVAALTCVPRDEAIDQVTGEVYGELVTLLAPLEADDYRALRSRFLTDKRATKALGPTLPERLVDAASIDTSELRKQGWSQPPAARKVTYVRPSDALRPRRAVARAVRPDFTTVQYVLVGKPLPRVEETLRIGELFRQAVMGQARRELGEDAIPPLISGHDLPAGQRHQHAFYLPWDSNGDGRIDRLLLHVPAGLGDAERRVVERLPGLWSRDGGEWRVLLEGIGDVGVGLPLRSRSRAWQSVTPYLHPWHVKKRFDIEDQVRRECRERGLPEPIAIERIPDVEVGQGRRRRSIDFHRVRARRGLMQADKLGGFLRLAFGESIQGPLALGFGCHFGLGLFAPVD